MNYQHFNINAKGGEIVQVELSSQAHVYLLDDENYKNYKTAREYKSLGGLATISPYKIIVPQSGHWNLVVDLEGFAGTFEELNVSVAVVPSN